MKTLPLPVAMCIVLLNLCAKAQITYPTARTEPFDTMIHGKKITDEFFWMSRRQHEKEVLDFSLAQTRFAHSLLGSLPGSEAITMEMADLFAALDEEVWNLKTIGDDFYYELNVPNEGIWLCRRKGSTAPEEKILQGSIAIKGQRYAIRKKVFAHRKPLLALMLTQQGERNPQIRIYDMDKKLFLADSIAPVMFNDARGVSMAWSPDDEALLYTQAPPTPIHHEIYYNGKIKMHFIGADETDDEPIFGIGISDSIKLKPQETPYIYSFKNSPYLIARIRTVEEDNYAFAVHYKKVDGANTPWRRLINYANLGEGFDAHENFLYAATPGGTKRQVVKINMETGAKPEPLVHRPNDLIAPTDYNHYSGIVAGKAVLYVLIRKVGDMQIMKVDLETKRTDYINLREKGTVAELSLKGENDLVFAFSSPAKSLHYKQYSYSSGKVEPLPFAEKAYDASDWLASHVIHVPSRDGKLIPVSLVYRKGINLKNKNRLLIEAYGNGGSSNDLSLNPTIFPWLKRDGIYAYAHVRGGGELGDGWKAAGHYPTKMNSINDVVDVAEYFTKNNYTSADKQLVMGQSAGTFLVGMSVSLRPDLFAGGIYLQGLPDLATYSDAASGRERAAGPKDTRDGFLSAYNISALFHVPQNKSLPAMFIAHGATDYILGLHPAARYAAKLQREQKGDRPILFMVDPEGGHLGGLDEMINIIKFSLWQTGHPDFQLKK